MGKVAVDSSSNMHRMQCQGCSAVIRKRFLVSATSVWDAKRSTASVYVLLPFAVLPRQTACAKDVHVNTHLALLQVEATGSWSLEHESETPAVEATDLGHCGPRVLPLYHEVVQKQCSNPGLRCTADLYCWPRKLQVLLQRSKRCPLGLRHLAA